MIVRDCTIQVKEHFHHHNVDKDKESLRNEVTKVKKQIVSGEHIALHQRSELQKLTRIIQEADEERQRQVQQALFGRPQTQVAPEEGGVLAALPTHETDAFRRMLRTPC